MEKIHAFDKLKFLEPSPFVSHANIISAGIHIFHFVEILLLYALWHLLRHAKFFMRYQFYRGIYTLVKMIMPRDSFCLFFSLPLLILPFKPQPERALYMILYLLSHLNQC